MAELIAIVGESGSGKTSSVRNLDPEKTFIISTTGKRPGIKGANKKYDVSQLQGSFRSIMVLKNRFGDCDVEIGTSFYGWINYFKELPLPDEIFDYEKYKSPKWALEEQQDNVKMEDNSNNIDNLSNHKSKFTL